MGINADNPSPLPTFHTEGRPSSGDNVCCDSFILRQPWAKQPSYWVDVYYMPRTKTWYLQKRWNFTRDGKLVEGDVNVSTVRDVNRVYSSLLLALQSKLDSGYLLHDRIKQSWSPFVNIDIAAALATSSTPKPSVSENNPSKEEGFVLKRTPMFDVW